MTTRQEDCIHHFLIPIANGPTSTGRCQKCQEVRDFNNASPDYGQFDIGKVQSDRDRREDLEAGHRDSWVI